MPITKQYAQKSPCNLQINESDGICRRLKYKQLLYNQGSWFASKPRKGGIPPPLKRRSAVYDARHGTAVRGHRALIKRTFCYFQLLRRKVTNVS
jgi:hypothetical protein